MQLVDLQRISKKEVKNMEQCAMKEILETKIPFRQLADHVNMGIIEFYSVGNISIGASQEILDDESVIILNLFCGDHYCNICGELKEVDGWKIPDDMLKEITETWNNLFMKTIHSVDDDVKDLNLRSAKDYVLLDENGYAVLNRDGEIVTLYKP